MSNAIMTALDKCYGYLEEKKTVTIINFIRDSIHFLHHGEPHRDDSIRCNLWDVGTYFELSGTNPSVDLTEYHFAYAHNDELEWRNLAENGTERYKDYSRREFRHQQAVEIRGYRNIWIGTGDDKVDAEIIYCI